MKRLILTVASALVLLVAGMATGAAAQATDPEVKVPEEGVAPGETITLEVSNLDPDAEVTATLGEATGEGTANAEGEAEIEIEVGDEAGEFDGIVTVNGVDVPFSVLVAAAQEAEGDGTATPSAVNTGNQSTSSNNSTLLFTTAAGLFLIGGAAVALRRRSIEI